MKHRTASRFVLLALLFALIWTPTASAQGQTIADIVGEDERFSTLLSLLEATGLDETLAGTDDAFTVFAPTNDAFDKIPANDLEALAKDVDQLRAVLLYHVVRGRTTANGVSALTAVPTLQGNNIRVTLNDGTVILDGRAQVTETDITTTNGIIHGIDTVLIPTAEAATATGVLPDSGAANSLPTLIALGAGGLFILLGALFALRRRA